MSELFDEDSRPPRPARAGGRRSRTLIITAVVIVLAFLGLTTFASLYTERLWYTSTGYGEVFGTMFWTKTGLFLVFGLIMAAVVGGNIYLAYRFRPFFRPSSPEQTGLDRYRDAVSPIRTWLLIGVSLVLGAFAGSSAIGQWRNYLLWRNRVPFHRQDQWFHKDIGFYVFDLPFWHYVVDFAMAVLVVAIVAAAVVHYLYGGIRLQASRDRLSGAAQVQLSVLVGLFVLAKAADYWIDRFDLVSQSGSLITGMTYTDDHAVLPAKNILLGISLICAVLFFVNVWRRTWLLPSVGLALLVVSAILLGLIWPGIVQQFQVKPSEPDKEASYIKGNIGATRAAYDLEHVQTEQLSSARVTTGDTATQLARKTSSVPLVDPKQVRQTFEQNQQERAYYSVAPVLDVDRYRIDGIDRALVLGVRELDQTGIDPTDRNWSNLHTVYTHGSGIIAAYANQRTTEDQVPAVNDPDKTQWAEGQDAGQDGLEKATGRFQPRIYFGEESPDYSIVGKASPNDPDVELDLPTGQGADRSDETTTYDGTGGVPIGSTFRRLMYAVKFGEPNFMLSGRVNANSRVLYDRDPRTRVEKVAPWLTVDGDPYPAVVNGRIEWILDGYTTTDKYPGSERESFKTMTDDSLQSTTGLHTVPTDEINYMRNAVKATVDAYDGSVTLYAWDESDPILQAWEKAFPGTVRPRSSIPHQLEQHLRYPEDLFKVQRYQYARYHVEDPRDFYQSNNRWSVPEDPNSPGRLQPPYRMFVQNPGSSQSRFSLTSTYVPYNKSNLASFLFVDSDATSDDYGQMRVLQVNDQSAKGPGQIANDFNSDQDVANKLAQFNRSGGSVIPGNLLTLPVDDGLIYVEPVYASRATSAASYPTLAYVLVSYNGEVGIGSSLPAALSNALTGTSPAPPATGSGGSGNGTGNAGGGHGKGGTGGGNGKGNAGGGHGKGNTQGQSVLAQVKSLLARADLLYGKADAARQAGRFGQWMHYSTQAQRLVERAIQRYNLLPNAASGSSQGPTIGPSS